MKDTMANVLGAKFVAQPVDVPALAFHVVFLAEVVLAVVSAVATVALGGTGFMELVVPHAAGAALAMAIRDGIWEGHIAADRARGIER